MKTEKSRIFRKIIKGIILTILIALFIYSVLYNVFTLFKINASFFGVNVFSVDSNTMSPELRKGYLVISFKTASNKLQQNDIIVYVQDGSYKVRRIMNVRENNGTISIAVKGDNTYYVEEVLSGNIQGKMIAKMPFMGNILKIVQSVVFAIIVFLLFVFVYIRKRNINKRIERRKNARIKMSSD